MTERDLAAVERIARKVHPAYPEDVAVPAERLRLWPEGCLVLEREGAILGYAVTHPWHARRPPALDMLLGALPLRPDTYYVHDVALLPAARGQGAAGRLVALLERIARTAGLDQMALIAVNGSVPFWQRQGFAVVDLPVLAGKLASYDAAARYMERPLEDPTQ